MTLSTDCWRHAAWYFGLLAGVYTVFECDYYCLVSAKESSKTISWHWKRADGPVMRPRSFSWRHIINLLVAVTVTVIVVIKVKKLFLNLSV